MLCDQLENCPERRVRRSLPEPRIFCNPNVTADFRIKNDKAMWVEKCLGSCKMSRIKISIPFVPNQCELLSNLKLCYYDSGLKNYESWSKKRGATHEGSRPHPLP